MRVSPNFLRSEFKCPCCDFDCVDVTLLETLESTRTHFKNKYPNRKIAITITSGCRCAKHNSKIGGANNSQHVYGKAVDFKIKNVHEDEVATYLETTYPNWFGIGRYTGRTHLDVRSSPFRWDNRNK